MRPLAPLFQKSQSCEPYSCKREKEHEIVIAGNRQDAGNNSQLQIQKNLPEGPGFGYRLMAQEGLSKHQEASGKL